MFYSKETFRDDSLRYNDKESWLKEGSLTLKKKQRANKAGMSYYVLTDLKLRTYTYKDKIGLNAFRYTDSFQPSTGKFCPNTKTLLATNAQKPWANTWGEPTRRGLPQTSPRA